jgi:hypothetical protein
MSDENINNVMSNNGSYDDEIIFNMTKLGMAFDDIKKQINDGNNNYVNLIY